jgi:lipopolysaccharide transport system ATP-binding protein
MIMDEVLAVGDMDFQKKCLDKMSNVSKSQGRTILYVSHNMNTIRQLCDRCIVLDHGKLIYDGEVEEAIGRYMDADGITVEKVIDLTSASRLKGISGKVLVGKAVIDKEKNIYAADETLDITYSIDANDEYDSIRFMMILFYQDGTRIGKTETENFTVHKGINEIPVSVSLEGLADGQYYFEISILQRSRSFAREKCDCIPNVIPFTIYNTEVFGVKGERWQSRDWGHIMIKPIELKNPGE